MGTNDRAVARARFATGGPMLDSHEIGAQHGEEFDIQWMPPGAQDVVCFVNDKPRRLRFAVNEGHAELLNGQLQEMLARASAGDGDEPFFDFNHEDGAASGHPVLLYWGGNDLKRGGIRARGKWTGGGQTSRENRDFTRFSPEWEFDRKTEELTGIGVNLGGLVNRAAFKRLAAVARDGRAGTEANEAKEKGNEMERKEIEEVLTAGLKSLVNRITGLEAAVAKGGAPAGPAAGSETAKGAAADDKIVLLVQTAVGKAVEPLTAMITAFESAETDRKTARAKEAVQAQVTRGAIAPEDKETIKFYTDNFVRDPEGTERAMAKLPGRGMGRVILGNEAGTATGIAPLDRIGAKAKEAAGTGGKVTRLEATETYLRSAQGNEDYQAYREALIAGQLPLPTRTVSK